MTFITDTIIYNLALASVILAICLYLFFTSTFNYWKDRGIPYIQPIPFFGSLRDQFLFRKHLIHIYQEIYDQLKGNKYGGYFEIKKPVLMIRDPALVQQILVKDFTHFYDRGFPADTDHDPLSGNLVNLEGEDWRHLRNKLTPTFTSGKLKGMFEQISKCGERLNASIIEQSKIDKSLDSKSLVSMFALDVIASCAFGIQMDKDSEVTKNYRDVVSMFFQPSKIQIIRQIILFVMPKLARKIGIRSFPTKMENTVLKIIREAMKYRKDNKINRNDFLQLILNLQDQERSGKMQIVPNEDHDDDDDVIDQMKHTFKDQSEKPIQEKQKDVFTEECIAAQAFVFFVAGSETVRAPLGFTLFALTQNPEIQKKVHNEIDTILTKHNNKWSYQVVKEMTYLDQVLQETFRKYPVAINLLRICTRTYKIPDSNDIIEKGTRVMIPIYAIHNDPDNYKSSEVFDPDRFVDNNFKPNGSFLPFGDGPRICIAMRFAVLEMKVAISRILSEYTVKLSSKTKVPIVYDTKAAVPQPKGGLWFEFDKR